MSNAPAKPMDPLVAQSVIARYESQRSKKLNSASGRSILEAWLSARSMERDRYGNFKSPNNPNRRYHFTKQRMQVQGRYDDGGWHNIDTHSLVEAATNIVIKAAMAAGEEKILASLTGQKDKRKEQKKKQATKAEDERADAAELKLVAKVISCEMPEEFMKVYDGGKASPEFERRYSDLRASMKALRRLGKVPKDQNLFDTKNPPIAPLAMDVDAEWVEDMRGVSYTVMVKHKAKNTATIEIGRSSSSGLGMGVDAVTRSMDMSWGGERAGDAYISGRISRGPHMPVAVLFLVMSHEKQKGAGGRVLDLWCRMMDAYGALLWGAEAVGEEGRAFILAKIAAGRLELVEDKPPHMVLRCVGGDEGRQQGLAFNPPVDEDEDASVDTELLPIASIWEQNKSNAWESGLTPEDVALVFMYDNDAVWDQADEDDLAKADVESVAWWIDTLRPFVGKEEEIPKRWNTFVDGSGEIVDGYHRITAAIVLGLDRFPIVGTKKEG